MRPEARPRLTSLSDALNTLRPVPLEQMPDWPHRGPRAVLEVMQGVRGLGRELHTFRDHWIASSWLHPEANVAWEQKMLLRILHHMTSVDQLDVSNLSLAELLSRRQLMLERATRANPRTPYRMVETKVDDTGGIAALDFPQHIAQQAEAEARVLRQQRACCATS